MIPHALAGSYERYKRDTALFTTWLAKTAAVCGYKSQAIQRKDSPSKPVEAEANGTTISKTPRLKGKERKAAKNAEAKSDAAEQSTAHSKADAANTVVYTVPTRELLAQARAIAGSTSIPRIAMPSSLRSVVERAIRARRRCTEWFRKSKIQNKYSDQQHEYFVKVLSDSLNILEPIVHDESPSVQSEKPSKERQDNVSLKLDETSNKFGSLAVEDAFDSDDEQMSSIIASVSTATKTQSSRGKPVIETFELGEESRNEDDIAFRIFCFFEDLHRIQDFLVNLWTSYNAGTVELHVAAITTNIAFGLVRRSEDEILAIAPKLFNRKRSWDTIAIIIFYADAFQQGVCPEVKLGTNETLRMKPFDDFIYLSTARILMKFTYWSEAPVEARKTCDLTCMPMRMGYISRPELLDDPMMRKKEEEDLTLSQFILDKSLSDTMQQELSNRDSWSVPPLEDELLHGIDDLLKQGVISVTTVFAARIYLDIQDIMTGKNTKALDDLKVSTKKIDTVMNLRVVDGAWDVGGSGERWHSRDMDIPLRIKLTSLQWVFGNPFIKLKEIALDHNPPTDYIPYSTTPVKGKSKPLQSLQIVNKEESVGVTPNLRARPKPPKDPKFSTISAVIHEIPEQFRHLAPGEITPELEAHLKKKLVESGQLPDEDPVSAEHEENAQRLNIQRIQPSKDSSFYIRSNSIFCGTLAFNLLTDFHAAGIALCNWHKTIWPTAHLYNALRQSLKLDRPWREMEDFIELHMGELFAGQLPLSGIEFYPRFALSLGVSPVMFARNPRRRTDNNLVMRPGVVGTKLQVGNSAKIYRRYLEKKETLETCLLHLETHFRNRNSQKTRREREAASRPLTNIQFLNILQQHTSALVARLQFDYITLTKQCARILKDLRTRIGLELGVHYPCQNTEDSADQTFPLLVLNVLEETKEWATDDRRLGRGAMQSAVGPQLDVAGEVLKNFIRTANPLDLITNFNQLPRNPRAPSGMVPNHWSISIRHVDLNPPGDLVFFVQPDSHYVHTEGPIQIVEGQTPGHVLNPKSLATLQVIARLIMKAFIEGMGSNVGAQAPWSLSTNDENFARRITKVMRDLGVREELLIMKVAESEEKASVDEDWRGLIDNLKRGVRGSR